MFNELFSNFKSKEKLRPSSEMKDGKIYYKLKSGLNVFQEELSISQNKKIVEIITKFDLGTLSLDSQIMDLVKTLLSGNVLEEALGIILLPVDADNYDRSKLGEVKNSELVNIFNDFFLFNPTAVSWLKTIGDALISIRKIPSIETSSSTAESSLKDSQKTAKKT